MTYYMPTKIYLKELKRDNFKNLGKKALIITGSSSAQNGSLKDLETILNNNNINYTIYNETKENPSLEEIQTMGQIGIKEDIDFVVGLGGGSCIDAAKAVSCFIKSNIKDLRLLLTKNDLDYLPVIAIPTTCGTGSEVTPYSILTDHQNKTKSGMATKVFPISAHLNYKYLETLPNNLMKSTTIDALCHLIEGFLTVKATKLSDIIAIGSFETFSTIKDNLSNNDYNQDFLEKVLYFSTMAGIHISNSGTSLPHGLGYNLTYHKQLYHGFACGVFIYEFLKFHQDTEKVKLMLKHLHFKDLEELKEYLNSLMEINIILTEPEVEEYINQTFSNKAKLKNHPYKITRDDISKIYYNSLKEYIN